MKTDRLQTAASVCLAQWCGAVSTGLGARTPGSVPSFPTATLRTLLTLLLLFLLRVLAASSAEIADSPLQMLSHTPDTVGLCSLKWFLKFSGDIWGWGNATLESLWFEDQSIFVIFHRVTANRDGPIPVTAERVWENRMLSGTTLWI